MRTLYLQPYSPWSERARWVMLHHGVPFVEKLHVPLLGELGLRARSRRWRGRATVPLLIDGQNPVMDSLAIAEYVDALGEGRSLFPGDTRPVIRELHRSVEPTLEASRAYLSLRVDDETALELLPSALRPMPGALRAARVGQAFLARKHRTSFEQVDDRLREGLRAIAARLAGRAYLCGEFTYADVICATALQAIAPVEDKYIPLGPSQRQAFAHPALASEFGELIAWRDELYRKHRPVRS